MGNYLSLCLEWHSHTGHFGTTWTTEGTLFFLYWFGRASSTLAEDGGHSCTCCSLEWLSSGQRMQPLSDHFLNPLARGHFFPLVVFLARQPTARARAKRKHNDCWLWMKSVKPMVYVPYTYKWTYHQEVVAVVCWLMIMYGGVFFGARSAVWPQTAAHWATVFRIWPTWWNHFDWFMDIGCRIYFFQRTRNHFCQEDFMPLPFVVFPFFRWALDFW